MATNQGFKSFVPDQEILSSDFLYWWLKSNKAYLQSLGRGATFKEVSKEIVEAIEIPLPPLEEQRRIAAILDKASKVKELSDTVEKLAKELRVSFFEEMLGSKVWPTAFVGDVVSRLTNGYVGPTRDIYVEEGIPYLLARHVKGGRLLYDEKTRISLDFNNKNKKSILAEGDVLLVQSGHIGSSCVVPGEHVGHNCHAMIVITPDHQILTGDYLSALFETPRMQRAFKGIQTGITVPHLNCRDVRKMEIPIPPLESQHELSRRLSTLSKNASMLETRRKHLESLTKSLGSNFFHDAL